MPQDDLADHPAQTVGRDRLGQKIDSAKPHSGHCIGNAAVRGDDNDGRVIAPLAHLPQRLHAVHSGHFQIQQDHIGRRLVKLRQRRRTVTHLDGIVTGRLKCRAEQQANTWLIVNDQDRRGVVHGFASLRASALGYL
jgi:hypothetical protein